MKLPTTFADSAAPSDRMERLVGLLVFAGDLEVNGEKLIGCTLELDRETVIAAGPLPMYEQCVIIPVSELKKMQAVITASQCMQQWYLREPGGMVVSAKLVRKLWAALRDLRANV